MPIIQVNLLEGRTVQQKRSMIAAVTEAVVESLGVNPGSVRIIINEMIPEHYAVSGLSAGEHALEKRNGARADRHNGAASTSAPAGPR